VTYYDEFEPIEPQPEQPVVLVGLLAIILICARVIAWTLGL